MGSVDLIVTIIITFLISQAYLKLHTLYLSERQGMTTVLGVELAKLRSGFLG